MAETATKMAHTSGPWRVNGPLYVGVYEERKVLSISQDKEHPMHIADIDFGSINPNVRDELRANANLLAAAPEMYEALTKLMERFTRHGDWDEGCFYYHGVAATELQQPIEELRAAIAKAEGRNA